jgi:cytochrome oxidase Cu insertion factor (SCO1/SenC/PrrC family)
MRQVRIALGKDTDRVQRLFVMVNPENTRSVRDLLDQHQGIVWATGNDDQMQGLVGQIKQATAGMPAVAEAIYLVDPLGNLMLRFPPDLDPRSMLKDLKRLLKVSRIG